MPIFEIGPLEPRYSEWIVFEGVSVDEGGKQHYLDARYDTHTHTHTHTHIHTRLHACTHAHAGTRMRCLIAGTCEPIHACMCVYVCV